VGKYHARKASRNRVRGVALLLALALALGSSGCSLTMHLTSFQTEVETTASTAKPVSVLSASLDEEDWRRAQSALSLAVDPQGSGQPVNWDNPGTKRRGVFVQTGDIALTESTICRPFSAILQEPGAKETRHVGKACRAGPGEWAIREAVRLDEQTASTVKRGEPLYLLQPLPPKTDSMLGFGERR
jgi:surface antigen